MNSDVSASKSNQVNQKSQEQQMSSAIQMKKKKRKELKQQHQATNSACSTTITRMVSDAGDCVKDRNVLQLQSELECMKCKIEDMKEQLANKNMAPSREKVTVVAGKEESKLHELRLELDRVRNENTTLKEKYRRDQTSSCEKIAILSEMLRDAYGKITCGYSQGAGC